MDLRRLRALPLIAALMAPASFAAALATASSFAAAESAEPKPRDPATDADTAPAVETDPGEETPVDSKEGDRVTIETEDAPEVMEPTTGEADGVKVGIEDAPEDETTPAAEMPDDAASPADTAPDSASTPDTSEAPDAPDAHRPPPGTPPGREPPGGGPPPPGGGPPPPGDRRPPPPGSPPDPMRPRGDPRPGEGAPKRPPPKLTRTAPPVAPMPTDEDQAAAGLPTLSALTRTRDRPLFVPGRRGVQPAPTMPIRIEPKEGPEEAPPPPLTLALRGVVTGPGVAMAMLADPADDKITRMKVDDEHDGWRLTAIDRISVTFRRGVEEQVLRLPPPGTGEPGKARPHGKTPQSEEDPL